MGKRAVHHLDFDTLVEVNREVVKLTSESSEYSPADGEKLNELVREVEQRADNQDTDEAVLEKGSLLIFKLASGQHFHAGNKRTAIVAGVLFLEKNGYSVTLDSTEFVSTVDKAGMAAATLDDVYGVLKTLAKKRPLQRKGWDKALREVVDSHRESLTKLGA